MSKRKVSIKSASVLTLGCNKNTVDSELIIGRLKANDINIVQDVNKADALIINTCGFIKSAKEESVNLIMQACDLKETKKIKKLIVVGCLAERYKQELAEQIHQVDKFFGINASEDILKELKGENKYELLGERELLTPKHYAYLKISDGCNHKCSFCAIPLIKGKYHSRSEEDILQEVERLTKIGVKELNIIAQDTTYYGIDTYGKQKLADLLKRISDFNELKWIRLLYTYPLNFPKEILDVISERDNICKYIDIPFQHVSPKILKSMKRGVSAKDTLDLIKLIKDKIPNIAIRTTFIVGYPNETEREFNELLEFVKKEKLDRVGVFTYSQEEDTLAFDLGDDIAEEIKNKRRMKLMEAQSKISLEKNKALIGKKIKVIIDRKNNNEYYARTEFDAPEVDNSVIIKSTKPLGIGEFYNVEIIDAQEYDLFSAI